MLPATPLWIRLLVIPTDILVPVIVWLAFRREARRTAPELVAPTFAFLALWLILAVTLSARGFFIGSPSITIPTIVWALLPLAGGYLAYLAIPSVRAVADRVSLPGMIGIQLYRVLGFVFLAEWLTGSLPGAFALPAGIGDVAIGLSAPFVAARLAAGAPHARERAIVWNVLGIADLVIAVSTAMLTSPGALHLLALDSPNRAITVLPLVLVPTIAVPLSLLLHFVGLHRLVGRAQPVGVLRHAA